MKFRLTFKMPDVLDQLKEIPCDAGEYRKAAKLAEKFVEWGEYVTIELDTAAKTATVVKIGE